MNQRPRSAITIAISTVLTALTTPATAGVFTATVPALAGVRMNYFDPGISAPVDFGQSFISIDKVTVSITGTGHTGSGTISLDPFGGGTPIDINASLIASIREPDGSASKFVGGIGPFIDTTSTQQASKSAPFAHLLDGASAVSLDFDQISSPGTLSIFDFPFVDIQSVTITVEGTSAASMGDPNGDGFVGIDDLNLALAGWNQNVTPGDVQGGDLDGDGFVGLSDLNVVLGNWNAGTPPPGQSLAVPEPGTLLIISLYGGALMSRRSGVNQYRGS
jgi:hypothetical protein